MPECAVGLMAKFPMLGKVKTRLGNEIGESPALTVYRKLLDNIISVLNRLPAEVYLCSAWIDPPEHVEKFATQFSGLNSYQPQSGIDLGARMLDAIINLLAEKRTGKAIMIGVDIPDIDESVIKKANEILETKDLVVGPTYDGGYYLIGMNQPVKELFTNFEWSTDTVFDRTISIAEDMNLKTGLMQKLSDIDNLDDLKKFERFYSIINL